MNDSFAHTHDLYESTLQRESGQDKESYRTVLKPEACRGRIASADHLHKQLGLDKKSYYKVNCACSRSQWPRGLRRTSAAVRLLRSWVWIPPGAWMSVCCECLVLSGRGLCDELITCPEESYRLWCVVMCGLEKNLKNEEAITRAGSQRHKKKLCT